MLIASICSRVHCMFKKLWFASLLALAAATLPAHTLAQTLTAGLLQIRSGTSVEESRDFFSGAKGLFDDARAAGRSKVRLVTRAIDDEPAQLTTALRELATQQRADVILGLMNEAQLDLALADPVLRNENVVFVAPAVGNTKYEANPRVLLLRAGFAAEAQHIGATLRTMGINRIAIALPEDMRADAQAMRDALEQTLGTTPELALASGNAAAGASGTASSTTFGSAAHLAAIKAKNPQAVIVAGDSISYATFYKAYRQVVPGTFIIGLSKVNPRTVLQILGADATGAIITQVAEDPRKPTTQLTREHTRIMRKYFDEPASAATLEGHLAARWLIQWATDRRAGAPAEQLRALNSNGSNRVDLDGALLSFGANQRRASSFVDMVMLRSDGSLAN
jgi:branched-chain amino acid transport system substrate-binding protein